MQQELFTIELQGHNYAFAFGHIVCVDAENKLYYTNNDSVKNSRQNIRITLRDACINKGNSK
jgi:hypothetical protein